MPIGTKDDAAKPDYSLLPTSWATHAIGVPLVTTSPANIAEGVRSHRCEVYAPPSARHHRCCSESTGGPLRTGVSACRR